MCSSTPMRGTWAESDASRVAGTGADPGDGCGHPRVLGGHPACLSRPVRP